MTGAKNRGGLDFEGDIAFDAGWDSVGIREWLTATLGSNVDMGAR
jgi:hypothetical protein